LSFVHNNQFYLCHGGAKFKREGEKLQYTRDQLLPLQRFDFSSAQWSGVSPVSAARKQRSWNQPLPLQRFSARWSGVSPVGEAGEHHFWDQPFPLQRFSARWSGVSPVSDAGEHHFWDQPLPLQRFSAQWSRSGVSPESDAGEHRFWTVLKRPDDGVDCALLGNCAYIHGTSVWYGEAVRELELNVKTMICQRLEPQNKKDGPKHGFGYGPNSLHDYARMVACGDEALCLISTTAKDNGMDLSFHLQLHLFHVPTG